mgnify:CR=1 FL=1
MNHPGGKASTFAVVASVDVYLSDFGQVSFIANRFQRDREAFILDPEYAQIDNLCSSYLQRLCPIVQLLEYSVEYFIVLPG